MISSRIHSRALSDRPADKLLSLTQNSLVLLRPIPLSLADYHKEAVAYTKVSLATGLFVTANTVERARAV
jgi:hypothetical protein